MSLRSHIRSVTKAITWRAVGAVDTFAIAYFVTGRPAAAMGLVGLEILTKSLWYYLHERAWEMPALVRVFNQQQQGEAA